VFAETTGSEQNKANILNSESKITKYQPGNACAVFHIVLFVHYLYSWRKILWIKNKDFVETPTRDTFEVSAHTSDASFNSV
jgi:hypothetical protein